MRILCLMLCVALVGVVPCSAEEETAMQAVEARVDQLLPVLQSDAERAEKRASIEKLIDGFFDFETMSKLALSYHWKDFSDDQRSQFVDLYRKLLESVYMDRILEFSGEDVAIENQIELDEKRAEVRTRVMTENGLISLDYKMVRRNGTWQVYDLVIENVSLAKNYRSQFESLLRDKSPDQLMENLRQKIEQNE